MAGGFPKKPVVKQSSGLLTNCLPVIRPGHQGPNQGMTNVQHPRILLIGTGDTKADELLFMCDRITEAGGEPIMMDVSVLGDPPYNPRYDKHAVALSAQTTIEEIAASSDENSAMAAMALGASRLARRLAAAGDFDGMIAIGGTMGTDLALDVALALPLGIPKLVVSTIAFSHLVPPERIAADLMMILWAGGLYGLNSTCKAVLSQACGAVVGAAKSAIRPKKQRPVVAITSLGKSCLSYMVELKPELERRGYEVVVFHTTGMGGRAMESMAAQGGFAAILDLSLQEVANQLTGSVVNSGADRLENAGKAGIPQIVAPGAIDMVDFPGLATGTERSGRSSLPCAQPAAGLGNVAAGRPAKNCAGHRQEALIGAGAGGVRPAGRRHPAMGSRRRSPA